MKSNKVEVEGVGITSISCNAIFNFKISECCLESQKSCEITAISEMMESNISQTTTTFHVAVQWRENEQKKHNLHSVGYFTVTPEDYLGLKKNDKKKPICNNLYIYLY